jgi:hypothetical protein
LKAEVEEFIGEFKNKMQELQVHETTRKIIIENMAAIGTNILCIPFLNKKYTVFKRFENEVEMEE